MLILSPWSVHRAELLSPSHHLGSKHELCLSFLHHFRFVCWHLFRFEKHYIPIEIPFWFHDFPKPLPGTVLRGSWCRSSLKTCSLSGSYITQYYIRRYINSPGHQPFGGQIRFQTIHILHTHVFDLWCGEVYLPLALRLRIRIHLLKLLGHQILCLFWANQGQYRKHWFSTSAKTP